MADARCGGSQRFARQRRPGGSGWQRGGRDWTLPRTPGHEGRRARRNRASYREVGDRRQHLLDAGDERNPFLLQRSVARPVRIGDDQVHLPLRRRQVWYHLPLAWPEEYATLVDVRAEVLETLVGRPVHQNASHLGESSSQTVHDLVASRVDVAPVDDGRRAASHGTRGGTPTDVFPLPSTTTAPAISGKRIEVSLFSTTSTTDGS